MLLKGRRIGAVLADGVEAARGAEAAGADEEADFGAEELFEAEWGVGFLGSAKSARAVGTVGDAEDGLAAGAWDDVETLGGRLGEAGEAVFEEGFVEASLVDDGVEAAARGVESFFATEGRAAADWPAGRASLTSLDPFTPAPFAPPATLGTPRAAAPSRRGAFGRFSPPLGNRFEGVLALWVISALIGTQLFFSPGGRASRGRREEVSSHPEKGVPGVQKKIEGAGRGRGAGA